MKGSEIVEAPSNDGRHLPSLSVVLVTPAGYEGIRTTLRHLTVQTIADRIELLVVTPDPDSCVLPADVAGAFHTVRIVGAPNLDSLAGAKARAVAQATASYVAFSEDHSFPEPGWAEGLLAGHARGYDGVAPEIRNGNPDGLISWVALFLHFGGVVSPRAGREEDYPTASHNMSYRRDALLELGDELEDRMLAETFLNEALRGRGYRLWIEPSAVTRHVNMAYLRPLLRHAWLGGRLYGDRRSAFGNWSLLRRLFYAFASPLIPLIRMRRTIQVIRDAGYGDRLLPRALVPMFAILLVDTAGEVVGYVLGKGSAVSTYSALEVRRDRFVLPPERALWA